jgi:carbamoylphosphate synthase large subunit
MRDAARRIISKVGVETGGRTFSLPNPADGRMVVIEMNPRVSRSSALASKATGFDRQDCREAGARVSPRRDPERHHATTPALRAGD